MRSNQRDLEELLELAAAISDRSKVDWDQVESAAPEEARKIVRCLREIALVENANRSSRDNNPEVSGEPIPVWPEQETPRRWAHLEIIEKIGEGSFGEVYRARDTIIDREVALKLLRCEESETKIASQVIEEGRLLGRVKHHNVARVYGADRHEGRVGLWMEFIRGRNLEDVVEDQGRLGANEAVGIARDLCQALASVHQAGILHRDINTRNVMREEGGRIVLMDFGTGREMGSGKREWDPEITGSLLCGTPVYMAPELFSGGPATARCDIYSLGVVIFHLLTARYPVEGRTYAEVSQAHRQGRRTLLRDARPDLPELLIRVIEKATEANPDLRYSTAGEFQRALAVVDRLAFPWWRHRRVFAGVIGIAASLVLAWVVYHSSAYEVQAELYRLRESGRLELLLPGATIEPGDQLQLEFSGTKKLFVYVISGDDLGKAFLLFPMGRTELKNPLPHRVSHRLPGTVGNSQLVWTVTSEGGREHVIIVVSPKRLTDFEEDIFAQLGLLEKSSGQGDNGTGSSNYAPIPAKAIGRLRGIGGWDERSPRDTQGVPGDVFEDLRKLVGRTERSRGTWIRQIDLEYARP